MRFRVCLFTPECCTSDGVESTSVQKVIQWVQRWLVFTVANNNVLGARAVVAAKWGPAVLSAWRGEVRRGRRGWNRQFSGLLLRAKSRGQREREGGEKERGREKEREIWAQTMLVPIITRHPSPNHTPEGGQPVQSWMICLYLWRQGRGD